VTAPFGGQCPRRVLVYLQASSVAKMHLLADAMPEPLAAAIDVCTYGVLRGSELFGSARMTSPGPPTRGRRRRPHPSATGSKTPKRSPRRLASPLKACVDRITKLAIAAQGKAHARPSREAQRPTPGRPSGQTQPSNIRPMG
jgi:hypothetical protein